jgi:hypothetical protein
LWPHVCLPLVPFPQHSLLDRCNVISKRAENEKKWPLLPDAHTKFLLVTLLGRQRHWHGNTTSISFVTACGKHFEVRRMSRGHTKIFQCRKYCTYWLDTIVETTKNFLTALSVVRIYRSMVSCHTDRTFKALSQNCEKLLLTSLCLFVRLSAWNNCAPTGMIFIKFNIWVFFEHFSRNSSFIKIWQK